MVAIGCHATAPGCSCTAILYLQICAAVCAVFSVNAACTWAAVDALGVGRRLLPWLWTLLLLCNCAFAGWFGLASAWHHHVLRPLMYNVLLLTATSSMHDRRGMLAVQVRSQVAGCGCGLGRCPTPCWVVWHALIDIGSFCTSLC